MLSSAGARHRARHRRKALHRTSSQHLASRWMRARPSRWMRAGLSQSSSAVVDSPAPPQGQSWATPSSSPSPPPVAALPIRRRRRLQFAALGLVEKGPGKETEWRRRPRAGSWPGQIPSIRSPVRAFSLQVCWPKRWPDVETGNTGVELKL